MTQSNALAASVPSALDKPSHTPSIRSRLSLLVSACILPLFGFGFGNALLQYETDYAHAELHALNTARNIALLIQRDLEARLSSLRVLAMSPTLQTGDIAAFRAQAEAYLAQQLPGANILMLRENGQQVMNTALSPDAPLPSRRDATTLHQLFATAKPSVSDVFFGVVVRRPIIALEVPVLRPDGNVAYGLALNPTLDAFDDLLRRQQLGENWIVSIIDRKGVIVARSPNGGRFVGEKASAGFLPSLFSRTEGIVETTFLEGVPVISVFSRVPGFDWSVGICIPTSNLTAPIWRAALITCGIGLVCLAFAVVFAQAMARRISRPIYSLRALAAVVDRHDFQSPFPTGLAETDDVAATLIGAACERREAERAREKAFMLLRTIVETAPGLIYTKDRHGRMVLANSETLKLIGKPWREVEGRTDLEFLEDIAQAEAVMGNDRRIMDTDQAEVVEEAVGQANGHMRIWLSTKSPMRAADGQVSGIVAVAVEITERKQVEERLRLMIAELNHRVKNTLAIVQAIAMQSLHGASSEMRQTFAARLRALASAHDVLTRENWEGAALHDVIKGVLAPYGSMADGRFQVSGSSLRLQPRAAVALSMGLHELITNALKYGALSRPAGQVEIRWETTRDAAGHLLMVWSERDGPPVTAPTQRGFGSRLIERGLSQDLGGTAQLDFAVTGVICTIKTPLAKVVPSAQVMSFPRVGSM